MGDHRSDDEPHVVHETTVIDTGGGGGSGGGGLVALVVLLIIVAVGAFLYFGGYLGKVADKADVNVNVAAPDIDLPDVNVTLPGEPASNMAGK
jgi:hypothetical protein